jgi:hypothetical protein
MQQNEITPLSNNNNNRQIMCKSIQKIYDTSPLSSLRSPSLNSNRLNGNNQVKVIQ